jgi:hypothetical protein
MPAAYSIPLGHATETGPAQGAFAITAADSELSIHARFLYNGVAIAALKVTTVGGDAVTLVNVPAGVFLPIAVKQVWSTGTTAGNNLIGFY